jgi:hypothetical protein
MQAARHLPSAAPAQASCRPTTRTRRLRSRAAIISWSFSSSPGGELAYITLVCLNTSSSIRPRGVLRQPKSLNGMQDGRPNRLASTWGRLSRSAALLSVPKGGAPRVDTNKLCQQQEVLMHFGPTGVLRKDRNCNRMSRGPARWERSRNIIRRGGRPPPKLGAVCTFPEKLFRRRMVFRRS